jgi:ketosteroid isomerase-like protein
VTSDEELEDFIRRGYVALNRAMGDPSGEQLRGFFEEFWHSDGVYVNPPDSPEPGEHRGTDAVWQQTRRWVEPYPDLQIEPLEIQVNGNRAFVWVRFSGHGKGSDIPIAMEVANVFTVEDGRVRRNEAYTDREEALAAAGLSD